MDDIVYRSEGANIDTNRIKYYTRIDVTFRKGSRIVGHEIILISMAARVLGMHPQTLRKYERLGLVRPSRTAGHMRVYSREEIARLRLIKRLVDDLGVNLAGVQQLLLIAEVIDRMRPLMRADGFDRDDRQRRLGRELDRISRLLGH